ncbi:MAG: hypothetical protein NVS3B16_06500 [Vulcanimicrobiaceae bacterium]
MFGKPLGPLGAESFHLGMGIVMAVAYVVVARDRLRGPGWFRGLLFAQIPGLVQLCAVLPLMGNGVGGSRLSPITPLLAWSINASYGAAMGALAERLLERDR